MSNASVHVGTWVDFGKGTFWGPTVTTTTAQGSFLIAFLALFVAIASRHIWGITRYLLHQTRATSTPTDGLHHQQQLVLRNSSTSTGALLHFLQLAWAWKGRPEGRAIRAVPLLVAVLAHICIFALAGIFSSQVLEVTKVVLLRSPTCGYLAYQAGPGALLNTSNYALLNAAVFEDRETIRDSSAYARKCYGNATGDGCNSFLVQQINTIYEAAQCPFPNSMCLAGSIGSLQADSGLIHTDVHLGINSPPEDSLAYRRVTTCAPLRTNGFFSLRNNDQDQLQFLDFFYGTYVDETTNTTSSATFSFDTASTTYVETAYPLNYVWYSWADQQSSTFTPIAELYRTDADITLIFLNNNAVFPQPVEDLLYHATSPVADVYGFGTWSYTALQPITVMGCTEQHQICDPNLSGDTGCSELTGWSALKSAQNYTGARRSVADDLSNAVSYSLLRDMFYGLGSDALLASLSVDGASSLFSSPLPKNQWQLEVQSFFSQNMAHLQNLIVKVATGPSEPASGEYVTPPSATDSSDFDICTNQKIRSAGYSSFNLAGFAVILAVGCAVIAINLCLPSIVGVCQSVSGIGRGAKEDWGLDHIFQVQRLAYEGQKLGSWSSRRGGVPTTLQATATETFGKPGRTELLYEPLELAERGLTIPEGTTDDFDDIHDDKDSSKDETTFEEYLADSARSSMDIVPAYTDVAVDSAVYDIGENNGLSVEESFEDDKEGSAHRGEPRESFASSHRSSIDMGYFKGDRGGNIGLRAMSFI